MTRRPDVRLVAGVAGAVVLGLGLAQVVLPRLAAKRVGDRVGRYGTVRSVGVSAWPAFELLWGKAGSAKVSAGSLTVTPSQIATLLWEGRGVSDMTVSSQQVTLRVGGLPYGLRVGNVRMNKHGSEIRASATLTQQELDEALPNGFHVQPTASGGGQVEVRASGGLFGVKASMSAVVRPLDGRLVAEPQGFPLAGLAVVTLFSDPHLKVESVGVGMVGGSPPTYNLSLVASLR